MKSPVSGGRYSCLCHCLSFARVVEFEVDQSAQAYSCSRNVQPGLLLFLVVGGASALPTPLVQKLLYAPDQRACGKTEGDATPELVAVRLFVAGGASGFDLKPVDNVGAVGLANLRIPRPLVLADLVGW